MGRACKLRSCKQDKTEFLSPDMFTNQLEEGSILDICGVSLLFQGPITMAQQISVGTVCYCIYVDTSCLPISHYTIPCKS